LGLFVPYVFGHGVAVDPVERLLVEREPAPRVPDEALYLCHASPTAMLVLLDRNVR
jgi:hypothetical protein